VWEEGINLVDQIYKITKQFPKDERYALCSQMQRASVSVPSNIAEGHARSSRKEFLHFLSISLGSLAELETQLVISEKLSYIDELQAENLAFQINLLGKRIRCLQKSLQKKVD
jgi:four helix bundle protein